jgi:hypothetical protein
MPSTYTPSLRTEQQGSLENDTTWGTKANAVFQQLEDAICGYVSVTHDDSANKTLTALNGLTDESRNMFIRIGGALTNTRNVVCPTAEKLYFVSNATTGGFSFVFKTSGGTGITIPNGKSRVVMCDGTNVIDALTDLPSGSTLGGVEIVTLTGTQSLTNKTITLTDSNLSITDNADVTKIAKFECSSIPIGTTRTYTFPNTNDTFVVAALAQTLTNKTFDTTSIFVLNDANTTFADNGDTTKRVAFQISGITTGTTRTWTFPDVADTFVGTTATQTLTNKTFGISNTFTLNDGLLLIADNIDATKSIAFQVSGLTTGTTRTWTFPDVSDTFVGLTATQTLTNKTLSGVVLTSLDANTTIQDNVDPTKQLQFQLSGITTGTTRTLTIADASGTVLTNANGRIQGRETIWYPASAMVTPAASGASSGTTEATNFTFKTLDFGANEIAYMNVAMPKSWNTGSTLGFIPYWTATAGTGTAIWTFTAVAISNDDAIDAATGGTQSSTDTLLATNDLHIGPESAGLTPSGTPAAEDLIVIKIVRTGTIANDVKLLGVKMLYTTNAADDA